MKCDPELWQDLLDCERGKMWYSTVTSEPDFEHLWLQAHYAHYVPFHVLTVCVIFICI